MAALHELLAVEKTLSEQFKRLFQDTMQKFGKEEYFQGHVKTLKISVLKHILGKIRLTGMLTSLTLYVNFNKFT